MAAGLRAPDIQMLNRTSPAPHRIRLSWPPLEGPSAAGGHASNAVSTAAVA